MFNIKTPYLGAGVLLSLALIAGRLAGFFRELLLAASFGISAQADVAIVLLTLPDLLVNLLLSGGLSVALVPALRQAPVAIAKTLQRQSSLAVTVLFSSLGVLFALAPQTWFGLLAPGVKIESVQIQTWALYALAASIPLTGLSGVTSAALNARERFFIAGCGTLIFNLCIMLALWFAVQQEQVSLAWLCLGICVGAFIRWGSQSMALLQMPSSTHLLRPTNWLIDRKLFSTFLAGLASASLLILLPVVIRAAASWLGQGQLAAFNYAMKLVELPLGILITTAATVAYPRLSQAYVDKNEATFHALLENSMAKTWVLSFAVVVCGWPFADAAVQLLLGYGRVTPAEQAQISALTQIALLSVPWVGAANLIAAAINARDRAGHVLRCNLWALFVLPILALPGLLSASPVWLMAALPGFYVFLTWKLHHALQLPRPTWPTRPMLKALLAMLMTVVPFLVMDAVFFSSEVKPGRIDAILRTTMALLSWSFVVYVGLKTFRQSPTTPLHP